MFFFATLGSWLATSSRVSARFPPLLFPVLVVAYLSASQNAYFYFTWSMAAIFFMISTSISQALFSEGTNASNLGPTVKRAVLLTLLCLVPVCGIAFIFAGPLLGLFGHNYAVHGATLLRICAIAAFPDAVTNLYISVLQVSRRLLQAVALNLFMAVVSIGLALGLLRHFGIVSIGWAWLAGQASGVAIAIAIGLTGRSGARNSPSYPTQVPGHFQPT